MRVSSAGLPWLLAVTLAHAQPAGSSGALPPAPPPPAPPPPPPAPSGAAVPPPAAPPVTSAPAPPAAAPADAPPPPGYPGYGYPPNGWVYPYGPPPYGYAPYGYWAPPPRAPKPEYPEDAAARTTPFLDMLTAGVVADKRYQHFFTVGVQAGTYLAARVRVVGRALLFTSEPDDDMQVDYYGNGDLPAGYTPVASERPAVLFGGSVGVAPVARRNFVFAPGIGFHTTNVGDYGSMLTLSMPFDWVTDEGARFGFEIDIGRAFGGKYSARCTATICAGTATSEYDRPAAPAFFAAFELGWGFQHPPAKLPNSQGVP